MGFSRQEYWSRLTVPSPGDLPSPGIKPRSPALKADSLLSKPPGKATLKISSVLFIYLFYHFLIVKVFFNFIFTLFYFTILYWFCHTLTWIHHGCIRTPNPEFPSHLPPHIIPLDHPHGPAPSILYPVLNIDWRFVSYMIVYMFQCHSPKSSHPLPLP